MKLYSFTILLLAIVSCTSKSYSTSEIKILNTDFEVTLHIKETELINEFCNYWEEKVIQNQSSQPKFNYKIDIIKNGKSTRWLYDSKVGLCKVLTVKRENLYLIPNYQEMNSKLNL